MSEEAQQGERELALIMNGRLHRQEMLSCPCCVRGVRYSYINNALRPVMCTACGGTGNWRAYDGMPTLTLAIDTISNITIGG